MGKGPATQQERVNRARPLAAETLVLLADNPALRDDGHVQQLVRIALQDYRLRYPSCRATQPWLFYDGNPNTARIVGIPERVDVYCLFCRVLLVHQAIWQHDYTDRLRPHTTPCALRSLAGQIEPGAPGMYRMPTSTEEIYR